MTSRDYYSTAERTEALIEDLETRRLPGPRRASAPRPPGRGPAPTSARPGTPSARPGTLAASNIARRDAFNEPPEVARQLALQESGFEVIDGGCDLPPMGLRYLPAEPTALNDDPTPVGMPAPARATPRTAPVAPTAPRAPAPSTPPRQPDRGVLSASNIARRDAFNEPLEVARRLALSPSGFERSE